MNGGCQRPTRTAALVLLFMNLTCHRDPLNPLDPVPRFAFHLAELRMVVTRGGRPDDASDPRGEVKVARHPSRVS